MEKKKSWGKIFATGLAVAGVACVASYLTYRLYCETQNLYDDDEFDDVADYFDDLFSQEIDYDN